MELETYRREAADCSAALDTEYYRHFAGLQAEFAIEPIYARYAALFTRAAVDELRGRLERVAAGGEEHRRLAMLVDFAVTGLLGQRTKELDAQRAAREANLMLDIDGAAIAYRAAPVVQANEPDADRRAAIERARLAALADALNPLYEQIREVHQATARELGFAHYRELCEVTKRLDLDGLHAETSAFARATDGAYERLVGPALEHVLGFGLDRARRSDLDRFFRIPEADHHFPAERLVTSFRATLAELGLDLDSQPGVVLDLESRPGKSPRAFCSPVRPPHEVYLVIAPTGGWDDYAALFHEGGHAEHYAGVDASLPFEYRLLGDNAVTECFAFLLEHLTASPEWLERHLQVVDPQPLAQHARAKRLLYLRRYCAKLSYERELHGGALTLERAASRYAELLGGALELAWDRESFLADVDPGFYCSCYLRAWALEAHLRGQLQSTYGPAWFADPAAGAELRALWRTGQRDTPDELLQRIGGGPLRFDVLRADLGLT